MAYITNELVCVGDSITSGANGATPWPGMVGTTLGVTTHNEGFSGEGWLFTNVISGHFLSDTTRTNAVDAVVASNPNAFLTLQAGGNDFANGFTLDQTYAGFEAYYNARLAAGWNKNHIIVCTLTSFNNALFDLGVQLYNQMLVEGARKYKYAIARVDLDPNMGGAAATLNPTYFSAVDQLHPTTTGNTIIADIVVNAVPLKGIFSPKI